MPAAFYRLAAICCVILAGSAVAYADRIVGSF